MMSESPFRRIIVAVFEFTVIFGLLASWTACDLGSGTDDAIEGASDAGELAALKQVTLSQDSASLELFFPKTPEGKSLAQAKADSPSVYTDPSRFGAFLRVHLGADNRASGARDAKFDGLFSDATFDTANSAPLRMETGAFRVPRDSVAVVTIFGTMNLATHRAAIRYIFGRAVEGADVRLELENHLRYEVGSLSGSFRVPPPIPLSLPTRADAETRALLRELLDSGI